MKPFEKGFPVGEYFLLLLPGYDIKLIFYLLGIYFFFFFFNKYWDTVILNPLHSSRAWWREK